jgi:hypothetical protein
MMLRPCGRRSSIAFYILVRFCFNRSLRHPAQSCDGAALRAIADLCSGLNAWARALPPDLPPFSPSALRSLSVRAAMRACPPRLAIFDRCSASVTGCVVFFGNNYRIGGVVFEIPKRT